MQNLELQWKQFSVDLQSFEAWVKSVAPNCVGNSADSKLTLWFQGDDIYALPTEAVTTQVPKTITEQAVDEETGELLFDEETNEPIMVDHEVMEDVVTHVPTGEPSVAQIVQAKWDEIDADHEMAAAYTQRAMQAAVKSQVEAIKAFCDNLLVEFNTENIMMGITLEDKTDDVLEVMGPVLVAIQSVSPTSAIKRAKAISPADYDGKYITAERILKFVNKIEAFIGRPLSTEL